MADFFSTRDNGDFFREFRELARSFAGYSPSTVRDTLRRISAFDERRVIAYTLFPLDGRWLYYEPLAHLLNRPRPVFGSHVDNNEFLAVVNESRRASETKPLLYRRAFDLHLIDVGAQAFFAELPIPRDREVLDRIVALGDQVSILLDPFVESVLLRSTMEDILGLAIARRDAAMASR